TAAYWKTRPRGFEPVDHAMPDAEARRYEAGLERFGQERASRLRELAGNPGADSGSVVTDRMVEVFLAQIRFLQAKGIAVLVVIPPNVRQWNYHAALIARLRRCCAIDIPLADFGDPHRWRDLFLPGAIRYDDEHMNAKGADVWSRALADRASEWLDDLH